MENIAWTPLACDTSVRWEEKNNPYSSASCSPEIFSSSISHFFSVLSSEVSRGSRTGEILLALMLSTQLTQVLLSFTLWFWTLITLVSYSHDLNVGTLFSCWIQSRNLALESLMELQVSQLAALSLFLNGYFQRSHYLLLALFCVQPHPVPKLGQICFLETQGLCWQWLQLFEVNAWSLQKLIFSRLNIPGRIN